MLGYLPSPPSNGVSIGPLRLHLYGFLIVAGVFAAVWLADRRWRARGGEPGTFSAVALWAVPAGLIGARLYHVATDYELYTHHPLDAFKIWQGGLGIWGGIAGGVLGGWLYIRRQHLDFAAILDCVAPALPLAQAIGRWGNYFNQELFGRPTTLPWGLKIDLANRPQAYAGSATFHPTFLYESLWDLAVVGLVLLVEKRVRLKQGYLFAVYVSLYTFGRFFTEYLRIDFAHKILGLRLNDWTSILVFVSATGVLLVKGRDRSQPQAEEEVGAAEDDSDRRAAVVGAGPRSPAGATAVDGETIDEATTGFLTDVGRPTGAQSEVPASVAGGGESSAESVVGAAVGAPEPATRGDSGTEGAAPATPEPATEGGDGGAGAASEAPAEPEPSATSERPAQAEPETVQPVEARSDEPDRPVQAEPEPAAEAEAEPDAERAAQAEPESEKATPAEPVSGQAEPEQAAEPEPEPEPPAQSGVNGEPQPSAPTPMPDGATESAGSSTGNASTDGDTDEGDRPDAATATDEGELAGRGLAGEAAAARRTLGWPFRRRDAPRD